MQATENYTDYALIAELSEDLGAAMKGIDVRTLEESERMSERGW